MVTLRRMLGGHVGLAKSKREKLQGEYNDLLNKYFVEGEQEELSNGEKSGRKSWTKKRKEKWNSLTDEQKEKVKAAWKKRRSGKATKAKKHYRRENNKEDDEE
jgi:23S rRNA G2069 N7-methylase RlmK/C1962 C5-methylase RlmI